MYSEKRPAMNCYLSVTLDKVTTIGDLRKILEGFSTHGAPEYAVVKIDANDEEGFSLFVDWNARPDEWGNYKLR